MKKLLLLLLLIPSLSMGQVLESVEFTRNGYYKVIVSDSLYSQHTSQKECLEQTTNLLMNGIDAECQQPVVDVSGTFQADSTIYDTVTVQDTTIVYDTTNVESLTLRNVNLAYQNISGERSLSYQAEAHGDSVLFEYFHNGQSLQKSLQYPKGGIVRDTLKDPPIDSIQVWVHGYWEEWVEPYHEIVDIAFLDTLGQTPDTTEADTMSQFFTDFTEYTLNAQPSDWTLQWHGSAGDYEVQDFSGDIALAYAPDTEGDRTAISWDDAGSPSDVEVLIRGFAGHSGAGNQLRSFVRASGGTTDETAYFAEVRETDEFRINKYVDGNFTVLSTFSFAFDQGDIIWIRFRVNGDTLQGKVWHDGNSEPSSWDIDITDSDSNLNSGWVGVGNLGSLDQRWYQVGIGTSGDTAPSSEPSGTTALSGSIDSSFTLSGNTIEDATLSGGITNESAISGNIIQQSALSGNIDTESSLTGNLIQQAVLSGELQAASELAGAVVKKMALSGQIDSESSLSASLVKQALLSGSIDAQSALSGNVIIVDEGVTSLSGSISTESSLSGNITATKQIQGIIESETDLSGDVIKQASLSGDLLTVSSLSADASIQKTLAGTLLVSSSISGELTPVGAAWGGTIGITNSPLYSISFEVKPMHKIDIKDDPLYTINIKVKDE